MQTGALPYSYFYSPGLVQARELNTLYHQYDSLRETLILLWPIQLLLKRRYAMLRMRLLEVRSGIVHWGGRL